LIQGYHPKEMQSAKAVANTLIQLGAGMGITDMSPMKVQKLVYFAHGWHLALNEGVPLISDSIQAWTYGPVIEGLYHDLKEFQSSHIPSPVPTYTFKDGTVSSTTETVTDPDDLALLKEILRVYGKLSGIQLSNLTHQNGTPWHTIASGLPPGALERSVEIPNTLIQGHFTSLQQKK